MSERKLLIKGTFWRFFSVEKTLFWPQDIESYAVACALYSNQEIYLEVWEDEPVYLTELKYSQTIELPV